LRSYDVDEPTNKIVARYYYIVPIDRGTEGRIVGEEVEGLLSDLLGSLKYLGYEVIDNGH